nr:hypothetical protein [Tanacetum cinerariifolium]
FEHYIIEFSFGPNDSKSVYQIAIVLTNVEDDGWCRLDNRSFLKVITPGGGMDGTVNVTWNGTDGSIYLDLLRNASNVNSVSLQDGSLENFRVDAKFFKANYKLRIKGNSSSYLGTGIVFGKNRRCKFWFGYASSLQGLAGATLTNTYAAFPFVSIPPWVKCILNVKIDTVTGRPLDGYISADDDRFHILYGVEVLTDDGVALGAGLKCIELAVVFTHPRADWFVSPKVSSSPDGGFGV